jgi:hypothetical protein
MRLVHASFSLCLLSSTLQGNKSRASRAHIQTIQHIHGGFPFKREWLEVILLVSRVTSEIAKKIIIFTGCCVPKQVVAAVARADLGGSVVCRRHQWDPFFIASLLGIIRGSIKTTVSVSVRVGIVPCDLSVRISAGVS